MAEKSTTPKRLMLINSAHNRHGKSTALKALRERLLHLVKKEGGFCDWSGHIDIKLATDGMFVFQINKVVIVMSSRGDSPEHIYNGLNMIGKLCCKCFKNSQEKATDGGQNLPDIYIAATRPCIYMHDILAKFAEKNGFQRVIKTHECWMSASEQQQDEANKRYVEEVINIINEFISPNSITT